ncbi:glycosyltransferase family 2 protein [Seonamhaeicola maritimus]|uniref:glycosyltransferase family 2 protein n=1 Tax=Seonamhaeicola maritimus TaxID=2591822 RepID=UPI0019D590D4|nr:glycosyltransferase family 2 protein [Seonamhaeicola maritimus]
MNINSLVSIIIPNYNRASLIGETLDSIIIQSYTNWECLVIDDGSSDDSENIVKGYTEKESRIQFYKRPDNRPKGANACRNYGLEFSKGVYINWFDSDDIMHPEKLKEQIKSLESNKFPFSVCQSYEFHNNLKNINLRYCSLKSENPFEDFLSKKIVWLTQAPLFKRSFIVENNYMFDEELQAGQEWELFARILFDYTNYGIVEKPLVYVRRHSDSISDGMSNDRMWNYYLARRKIYDRFKLKLSSKAKISLYRNFLFFFKCFVREKDFRRAKIIWMTNLRQCPELFLKDHFNLAMGCVFMCFFNKGDGYLSRVSLYDKK